MAIEGAAVFLNSTDVGENRLPSASVHWLGMTFSIAFLVETTTKYTTALARTEVAKLLLPCFTMLTLSRGASETVVALTTATPDDGKSETVSTCLLCDPPKSLAGADVSRASTEDEGGVLWTCSLPS
jgi:hypothetical protein